MTDHSLQAAISLLVAATNGAILWAIGLDLWLVFSVLTFWVRRTAWEREGRGETVEEQRG